MKRVDAVPLGGGSRRNDLRADEEMRFAEIVDAHRVKWVSGQKPFRCDCGLFVHNGAEHAMHVGHLLAASLSVGGLPVGEEAAPKNLPGEENRQP